MKHTCMVYCRVSTNEYIYIYIYISYTYIYDIIYVSIYVYNIYIYIYRSMFYRLLQVLATPKMISLIWRILTPLTPLSELPPTLRKSSDTSPCVQHLEPMGESRDPQIMGLPYGKLPIPFPYLWGILMGIVPSLNFQSFWCWPFKCLSAKHFASENVGIWHLPHPPKKKIDTQNGHLWKDIHFPNHRRFELGFNPKAFLPNVFVSQPSFLVSMIIY